MKEDTLIVTAGRDPDANHGVVNPPVYHASTILHATVAEMEEARKKRWEPGVYTYGRQGTPTHEGLETAWAAIEGGWRAVCVASGLAAINAGFFAFLKAGDHALVVDCAYGPVRRLCDVVLARYGVETTYFDPAAGGDIRSLFRPNTKLIYVESPGSLTFEMQDIAAIAEEAHKRDIVVAMDNTWGAGIYFKPFAHGVDVSFQAATKYICGHSDVMMGIATMTEATWRPVRQAASDLGANSGPDDVYLGQRGLRTIKVRLARHFATGVKLAEWLKGRPEVERVLHPALPDDPGHAIWKRDFTGASGLFGVVLKPYPKKAIDAMLDGLELYGMGASWGGFESLILPTHPEDARTATKWPAPGRSLRIHAGLEDPDDLIADLKRGFERLNANAG